MISGRPTKYRPEYCQAIVECAQRGFSLTAFAAEIGVCRDTISEWASVHPSFSAAARHAKSVRTRAWEERVAKAVENGCTGGQASLIQFMLKNHDPDTFRDKHEVGVSGGMTLEQLVTSSYKPADDPGSE